MLLQAGLGDNSISLYLDAKFLLLLFILFRRLISQHCNLRQLRPVAHHLLFLACRLQVLIFILALGNDVIANEVALFLLGHGDALQELLAEVNPLFFYFFYYFYSLDFFFWVGL